VVPDGVLPDVDEVIAAAVPTFAAAPLTAAAGPARPRARPDDGPASNTSPGGDGPTLGASSALGGVAALLLGIWTAVLVTACVLVVPRLRHRRWSGLTWRLPRLSSTRLERPG
jgi:hypothetical protein